MSAPSRKYGWKPWFVVIAGLTLVVPSLAAFAAPMSAVSLGLSPSSGAPGSSTTASGTGWTASPSNPPYIIFWEVKGGTSLGSFAPGGSGTWSKSITIPGGASPGAHNIVACEGYGIEFEVCTTSAFTVVAPTKTPTPPPTRTPTKPVTPTRPPSVTPTGTATTPPTACGDLGLGPEAEVMTFDEPFEGTSRVIFESSAVVEPPTTVRPHSGTQAARSRVGMEFGSGLLPITMVFDPIGATAVGMFVGLDTAVYVSSDVTATLQAFGYRAGSDALESLGSSGVTFPPTPTDIQHCLVFHAAEGETIARIEVEYTDAGGTTMADPRWIDDATFVWAAQPLPEDDQPPVVEISQPEERSVLVGGSVDLRATIREDRSLDRVWYRINGGPQEVIGYSGIAGDPTTYLTGFGVSPLSLVPYTDNTIEVTARDAAGLEGHDQVVVNYNPPTPTPSLDIYVSRFEVTQAIQCMQNPDCGSDNSIPIYTGKPTLIRLYAASNASAPGISGRLCHAGECITSLNRITARASADPVAAFRPDLTKTLNFLLPSGWITRGRMDFTVEVNPDLADAPECCRENNLQNYFFSVSASKRLDIKMMRVQAYGIAPPGSARWTAYDYLKMVYPTGDIHLWTLGGDRVFEATYDYTDSATTGCGDGWDELLDDLWWHNVWNDDPVDWYRYYGMLDDQVPHSYSGCGYTPGDEAGGVAQTEALSFADQAGMIAAQEIGHNHGRHHVPGCNAGGADGSYPAGDDAFGNPGVGITGEWGIDLRSMTLKPPDMSYDFMGYCGGPSKWVSPYTYRALGSALRRVALELPGPGRLLDILPIQTSPEYLVGSIRVENGTARLTRGFVRRPLPSDVRPPDGASGTYAVDLLDEGGASLLQRLFDPTELSNADSLGVDVVRVWVPWVDGTAAIAFSRDGRVLLSVPVSVSTPAVQLVSPNGGESWGESGARRIEWQASDADGDPLDYTLQLSLDGGQTWSALAIGVTDTSYEVEAADLGGSDRARVRVVASDGVNTASDESDADFSIGKKGPQIILLSPDDGQTFGRGDEVVLYGAAVDYEDGTVPDEALVWTSDLDGELGRGPSLWGLTLSQGVHRITISATDRDQTTASQSVTITIGEAGEAPKPSTLVLILWVAGLLLVGIAGLGILVFALRGRGASR